MTLKVIRKCTWRVLLGLCVCYNTGQNTKEVGVPSSAQQHSSQLKTVMCALCNTLFVGILIIWGRQQMRRSAILLCTDSRDIASRHAPYGLYGAPRNKTPACFVPPQQKSPQHRNSFCNNKHHCCYTPFTLCYEMLNLVRWFSICCRGTIVHTYLHQFESGIDVRTACNLLNKREMQIDLSKLKGKTKIQI